MPNAELSMSQRIARSALIVSLVGLGVWMLHSFVAALCWAVVLAIATSALYDWWLARFRGRRRQLLAAATFTMLVGLVLIVPLVYGAALAVSEALSITHAYVASAGNGAPAPPAWLTQIPLLGEWLRGAWRDVFATPGAAPGMLVHLRPVLLEWTRRLGIQAIHRVVTLVFTLLTLFFVYVRRDLLGAEVLRASRRLFGASVDRLLVHAAGAIRATVDGVVLVAVAEGAIMAVVYAFAGVAHPVLLGAVTGLFAMIPFAAPIAFGAIAVALMMRGAIAAAVAVATVGTAMLFVADHLVRPAIIGGAARLPFLWVLLGILGGVESFGLLGIFLGPALMAALVAIWRESAADVTDSGARPAP